MAVCQSAFCRMLWVVVLLLSVSGCAPSSGVRTTGDSIKAAWQSGDARSELSAEFDQAGALARINESMQAGEFGYSRNTYVFSQGRLVRYTGRGKRMAPLSAGGPDKRERVEIEMSFSPTGTLLEGSKTVDGVPQPLDDWEASGVRRHARELEKIVIAQRQDGG